MSGGPASLRRGRGALRPVIGLSERVVPGPSAYEVGRPWLRRRLTENRRPLVLLNAPAGSGKTALLAQWARELARGVGGGEPLGWVSYEPGDEDFWTPVLATLADLGVDVPPYFTLRPTLRLGPELLDELVDGLRRAPNPVTLVLDDCALSAAGVASEVDVLLRHSAGRVRLVLSARYVPELPLHRYRIEDLVQELHGPDLAFTAAEARELMRRLGVPITPNDADELVRWFGGWAAGLRIAARALRSARGSASVIEHVRRQSEHLDGYVEAEVLDRLAPDVRRFVLAASVLDELCLDRVQGVFGVGSRVNLNRLVAEAGVFLEPLPGHGACYRFPPFFLDLLRARRAYESRGLSLVATTPRPAPSACAGPPAGVLVSLAPRQGTGPQPLVDPLTPRELEVLAHMEELLTTEEMARTMFISVNTVRTHVRSVLRKLDVDRRNAAVRRARELGLVGARD